MFPPELRTRLEQHGRMPPEGEWTPLDRAIYVLDPLRAERRVADELRLDAIRYGFRYQYDHNRFYRMFCDERHVGPTDIRGLDDLEKIPLVPDVVLKGCPGPEGFVAWLSSISSDELEYPPQKEVSGSYDEQIKVLEALYGIKVFYTSGTSGRISFVPADQTTRRRKIHSMVVTKYDVIPNRDHFDELYAIMLLPRRMGGPPFVDPARTCSLMERDADVDALQSLQDRNVSKAEKRGAVERPDGMLFERTLRIMRELKEKERYAVVYAFPFMMHVMLNTLEREGVAMDLGPRWSVFTAGGWKMEEGKVFSEEALRARIVELLRVPDENIRDDYAMTENIGGVGMACEGHYKHITHTFLHTFVLDEDLEPKGFGEYGRFAFINPIVTSFPSFVVTGDRVKVLEQCPGCERPGPVIEPNIARMPSEEDRGCADIVRRLMFEALEPR